MEHREEEVNYTWDPRRNATVISVLELQFGVELEMLVEGQVSRDAVVRTLVAADINARRAEYSGNNYQAWQIKPDGSIHAPPGWSSFELVSPILKGQKGCNALRKVLQVLHEAYHLDANDSCGLHVHLDMKDAPLRFLVAFCQNLLKYEKGLDLLVKSSRQNNGYIHSNRETFGRATNKEVFVSVGACESVEELMKLMNPARGRDEHSRRYYKFNLQRLLNIGTIEVRLHHGTTSFDTTKNWVKLLLKMVEWTKLHPPKDCLKDDRTPQYLLNFLLRYVVHSPELHSICLKKALTLHGPNVELQRYIEQLGPIPVHQHGAARQRVPLDVRAALQHNLRGGRRGH